MGDVGFFIRSAYSEPDLQLNYKIGETLPDFYLIVSLENIMILAMINNHTISFGPGNETAISLEE